MLCPSAGKWAVMLTSARGHQWPRLWRGHKAVRKYSMVDVACRKRASHSTFAIADGLSIFYRFYPEVERLNCRNENEVQTGKPSRNATFGKLRHWRSICPVGIWSESIQYNKFPVLSQHIIGGGWNVDLREQTVEVVPCRRQLLGKGDGRPTNGALV